ncbi:MAG TPA: hypothetical protein VFI92_07410 [Steroidobacteraceae bacterium]|nr:hypothetical protein [Steroidobacteraceae bacterium]
MAASFIARAKGLLGLPDPSSESVKPLAKQVASHHAVSIATGPRCCAAARALRGERFLSREAPKLPLKECDRDDCACRYEHYQDRRQGLRRARDMGVAIDGWIETDKRGKQMRGRRKADQRK